MNKLLYTLAIGLCGAVIVHIVTLLLTPHYARDHIWNELESRNAAYQFHRIDAQNGMLAVPDSMLRSAVCRFSLGDGPVHITAEGHLPFWSISVFSRDGINRYSLNDRTVASQRLDLIIADRIQMLELKQTPSQRVATAIISEQPIKDGFVILRVLQTDESWQKIVDDFFTQAQCRSLYQTPDQSVEDTTTN